MNRPRRWTKLPGAPRWGHVCGNGFEQTAVDKTAIIHDGLHGQETRDIVSMPRGGPDASWLDRRLQTNRLEYLDRDDVDDLKRKVVQSLDRAGRRRLFGAHEKLCPDGA